DTGIDQSLHVVADLLRLANNAVVEEEVFADGVGVVPLVKDDRVQLGRLDDLAVVAPQILAVALEHLELVAAEVRVAADIAGITVLRDELERHLLTTATDPERDFRS